MPGSEPRAQAERGKAAYLMMPSWIGSRWPPTRSTCARSSAVAQADRGEAPEATAGKSFELDYLAGAVGPVPAWVSIFAARPFFDRYEIVGVARDSHRRSRRDDVGARFRISAAQRRDVPRFIGFVVRTVAEPSSTIAAVRQAILAKDRNLPIAAASTPTELVDEQMVQDRLLVRLSTAFGIVGLVLAAIGLYGVVSSQVFLPATQVPVAPLSGPNDKRSLPIRNPAPNHYFSRKVRRSFANFVGFLNINLTGAGWRNTLQCPARSTAPRRPCRFRA